MAYSQVGTIACGGGGGGGRGVAIVGTITTFKGSAAK